MLHFGREPRYILHASSPYCDCLLYYIWTKSTFSFLRYNKYLKFMKNTAIITHMCHGSKCYFTCISSIWYLLTVQTMNKINLFFSEISQQTLNYWNTGHKCYILAESQGIFYMHQVLIVIVCCTTYEQNQPFLFWDITNT